jgi:hypothetical protein
MDKQRDIDSVLLEIKRTLVLSNRQARKAKGVGSDKLSALAKLANAYARVLTAGKAVDQPDLDPMEHGSPEFYSALNE